MVAAGGADGRIKLTGRILDYTGRELRMELAGGPPRSIPAEQVVSIETQYGPRQIAAEAAFAAARFEEALTLYRQAQQEEPRRWVRRRIIARRVWCYRGLSQPVQAGEEFRVLIHDDPSTPYFDCIPLAWIPRQPPIALEQAAGRWLQREEPAVALLGASHLLSSSPQLSALASAKLKRLTLASDRRIAGLAMAQTWRTAAVTAADREIDAWAGLIERMPESLAAGPYFVLGRARAQRQQWEQAALALLRVAVLYPQQRWLAAQSLLDAGRSLEKLGRTAEALRLYRELIGSYPEAVQPVAEAKRRIEAMGKK